MKAKGLARQGLVIILMCYSGLGQTSLISDLLISEIMIDPAKVSDQRGEWFELYNPTPDSFNLRDLWIGDDDRDRHRIETDLLILPLHFLVLARNGARDLNGGFDADYVYADFSLSNAGDEIVISDGDVELIRLEYGRGFSQSGHSSELLSSTMSVENYRVTPQSIDYGLGDSGSPGLPGSVDFARVPVAGSLLLFAAAALAQILLGRVRHG